MKLFEPIELDEEFNRQVWKKIRYRRRRFMTIAFFLLLLLTLLFNFLTPKQESPFVFYIQAKSTTLEGEL